MKIAEIENTIKVAKEKVIQCDAEIKELIEHEDELYRF